MIYKKLYLYYCNELIAVKTHAISVVNKTVEFEHNGKWIKTSIDNLRYE